LQPCLTVQLSRIKIENSYPTLSQKLLGLPPALKPQEPPHLREALEALPVTLHCEFLPPTM
jgi:hypothetical protein